MLNISEKYAEGNSEIRKEINNLMPREDIEGIPFENWECRYCPFDNICTRGDESYG